MVEALVAGEVTGAPLPPGRSSAISPNMYLRATLLQADCQDIAFGMMQDTICC
jgi:hypothetical protein